MPESRLHPRHLARGATVQELSGRPLVERFGGPAAVQAEYRAARTGAGLLDLSYREQVRLTGEDRASFLQGMVTQDLRALQVGEATYTALLTAKGAMVSDARLIGSVM